MISFKGRKYIKGTGINRGCHNCALFIDNNIKNVIFMCKKEFKKENVKLPKNFCYQHLVRAPLSKLLKEL